MYHGSPWGFAATDLAQGNSIMIMPRFDASEMLRLMEAREIRHSHCVPVMFHRALQLSDDERAAFDPSSLHCVLHGAAPISITAKQKMIDWWGPVLVEYWGTSETGGFTSVNSHDWLAHPGTVGRGGFTYDVVAMDANRQVLPPGEVGALYGIARSGDAGFEYHNDAAKTAEAIPEPGLVTLGDMGYVDADGWVFLSDRASDMIISGGVNIYPAEIEQLLVEHPAVRDAGVFGVPDAEWGESVKAAIELRPGYFASDQLAAEILAWAKEKMAGYKVPRSIDFEEQLPRQENGKLYKRVLKDRYWPKEGRRI
jgi:acyl-CoA synthetase (AMP-forming)/AMP-acid ligase II